MSFLNINNVSHTYFTSRHVTKAIDHISFTVEEGEFVSLLGPSGCGKTTLLSIIAGLMQPTEGEISIDGKRPHVQHSSIGYMLQQDYLFPWKTIEENILLGLKMMKLLNETSKHDALQLLADIGLNGVEKQFPRQLSGGMRQRAALVRTLAVKPKVLLLDEPFSALDFQTKLKLEDLVFDTLKQFKKTAVLVTHDIGEAISMSDRIVLLAAKPGRIHKIFNVPEELRELKPFSVRSKEAYSLLFNEIWKELESLETDE
ncbi:ABC transporter ATP-binding protein [Bacillus ginsengihumi]|uniref:ABC transporter ATP-binding protein n=1 Tax=Heyndrickxia ginsengihumi TaxID=363870 RepID=A0A0A6VH54_9BACI|nr:ABC transporter ATP-binding protein [Heyndrickxia ginsengihumi]KHD85959.1 spermidine/putrescine ABC transporter ATP-binding protein [Heyndrickxia ginsengihumi]NEY21023.1 ABC transporter ATP-binding protein [Heyndrickxia ginsengihumi]